MSHPPFRSKKIYFLLLSFLLGLLWLNDSKPCAYLDEASSSFPLLDTFKTAMGISESDTGILVLTDLPSHPPVFRRDPRMQPILTDHQRFALEWARGFATTFPRKNVTLGFYQEVGAHGRPLPERLWIHDIKDPLPSSTHGLLTRDGVLFSETLKSHPLVIAITRYSATSNLKAPAREMGFRGFTMPGFTQEMMPALRVDAAKVFHYCAIIGNLLDEAESANLVFEAKENAGSTTPTRYELFVDLRQRQSSRDQAVTNPGIISNLPFGEAFIVPFEGTSTEKSRTSGILPVQLGDEVVLYEVVHNRAVRVMSQGSRSVTEQSHLNEEPAYGNIAEVGFGVLSMLGLPALPNEPGNVLYNEKLGLHVAFGKSDHFKGGTVGDKDFNDSRKAVHIDRVYLKDTQPLVQIKSVTLRMDSGTERLLMVNGTYAPGIFNTP